MKAWITTAVVAALAAAGVGWDLGRQRDLAARAAVEAAEAVLGSAGVSVVDVDSFDRTWSVLVQGPGGNAVLVNVHGSRGLPFLPLLNGRESMRAELAGESAGN